MMTDFLAFAAGLVVGALWAERKHSQVLDRLKHHLEAEITQSRLHASPLHEMPKPGSYAIPVDTWPSKK